MTSRTLAATLFALAAASTACRSSGSGGPDAKPSDTPDASSTPDDTSIYDIQDPTNKVAVGQAVTVRGVVVTAIDTFGVKTGNFWVEEPGGGPYSGVLVFGASVTDVGALQVGDIVDIEGAAKDEFHFMSDPSTRATTELIKPMGGAITVTKKGSGTPLEPAAVDALAIGQLATAEMRDAEWEKWEGVLIKVSNVSANGKTSVINSATNPDPTFQKFPITGVAYVESSLAAMPDPAFTTGDCLGSVTGVGDYFFDWLILPRSTAEMMGGGSGCPAAEAACDDGKDNDGNGFVDCDDNSCKTNVVACPPTSTTVASIQMGTTTGAVTLTGVYVTAVGPKSYWVADALVAAPYNGIQIYFNSAALPSGVVPGAKVDVTGTVTEYSQPGGSGTTTQIKNPTTTVVSAPTAQPTPIADPDIATLADATAGEPYEGVLVKISNAKVTVAANNFGVGTMQIGTTTFAFDSEITDTNDAVGTCFASITGVWSFEPFSHRFEILPITKTTGGTCP